MNINSVVITGNLTRDPELRQTGSGTPVCNLGIGVNYGYRNGQDEWVDKPNFFNVTVWGAEGERCAEYLSKGQPVAIKGRLEWKKVPGKDGEKDREYVSIAAQMVQFLGGKPKDEEPSEAEEERVAVAVGAEDDIPL